MNTLSTEQIGKALGRVPSGCAILTSVSQHARMGMLASWVQQAGFDPPAISVAVKKGRPIEPIIDQSGRFTVNVIGEDPAPMFRQFGKGFATGEDAFAGVRTKEVEGGVMLEDAVAVLSCRVAGKHDTGDHWLYVGHIVNAMALDGAKPYVHLRKNGLNY